MEADEVCRCMVKHCCSDGLVASTESGGPSPRQCTSPIRAFASTVIDTSSLLFEKYTLPRASVCARVFALNCSNNCSNRRSNRMMNFVPPSAVAPSAAIRNCGRRPPTTTSHNSDRQHPRAERPAQLVHLALDNIKPHLEQSEARRGTKQSCKCARRRPAPPHAAQAGPPAPSHVHDVAVRSN